MLPYYRFYITLNEDTTQHVVRPIFKDDIALDYSLESSRKFYRKNLTGKLSFVKDDFDFIYSQPFDTEFRVTIEVTQDFGKTKQEFFKGKFYKTDCTINIDDKMITVQPSVLDDYTNVLAGIEREFNLVELAPEIEPLTIKKRPLIQIYIPEEDTVSCFIGGVHWEQDVTTAEGNLQTLQRKYHFALCNVLKECRTATFGSPRVSSIYVGAMDDGAYPSKYSGKMYASTDQEFYMYAYQDVTLERPLVTFEIRRTADDVALFRYQRVNNDNPFEIEDFRMTAVAGSGATGYVDCFLRSFNVMARYLLDVPSLQGYPTTPIAIDDIVADNRNYKFVIGYDVANTTTISNRFSVEPTKYGKAPDGRYYEPPYFYGEKFYPLAQSKWLYSSLWFRFSSLDQVLERDATKGYILRDNYTLASCINVLLKQIAPEITHEATPEYSQFLYSETNPVSGEAFEMFITPKSNVLNGEYKTPALKATVTLQQILSTLENTFRCYWYIEDKKLKIEHISFFSNGGSYQGTPVIGFDLTEIENVRNGRKWAFDTNKITYEKEQMPQRFQFAWADETTQAFDGYPIEIRSKFVMDGRIEDININGFTSNIDYMLLNPSDINQDGFALFAGVRGYDGVSLPIIPIRVEGVTYHLQNGFLSYLYLHPNFWRFDMPAPLLKINNENTEAITVDKRKKQTLTFPAKIGINTLSLVKTDLGAGQIEKLTLNLSDLIAKTTLKYDTDK